MAKQTCGAYGCGGDAEVIFRPTRYERDWLYLQCDECGEYLCTLCAETDDCGNTICVDCLQTKAVREVTNDGD